MAAGSVLALVIFFVCFLVMREKQGKPVFKKVISATKPKLDVSTTGAKA